MESNYGFFHDVEELWIMFQGLKEKKCEKIRQHQNALAFGHDMV